MSEQLFKVLNKRIIFFIALILLISYAYAVPNLINFQGKLRNGMPAGDYEILMQMQEGIIQNW
jgi:uncharacterized membrane protein YesL